MKRAWKLTAAALFLSCVLLGGLLGDQVLAVTDETRTAIQRYTELLDVARAGYGDEITYDDLVGSSIQGLLRNLDPHSNYLAPESYDTMRERQQSSFYGLGILVGQRNGQLTVVTPIEGTPASRMGMRAGDVISAIEGEQTKTMTLNEAVRLLKGPKGTNVTIQVVRRGLEEPLELTITRDEIPQNAVRYSYMLDDRTGYIALTDFNRGTGEEIARAVEELRQAGMEQLLLDLRYNGGGLLDQAIEVADQFLPDGSTIVETRGRARGSQESFSAEGRYRELAMPVVALVNEGTASAAEILAGAIQDHDMGLIAGTSTWGKGLVQTVYSLSYGSGIALTTARYYTPSGRLIQRDYSSWLDYSTRANVDDEAAEPAPEQEQEGVDVLQQAFFTDLGREVYGGGGIAPDVEIEPREIPAFIQYLASRNAFFDFGIEFANLNEIAADWRPDDQLLAEFESWLIEEELTTREELTEELADPELKAQVADNLRAEVIGSCCGLEARHRILAERDEQIRRGLELFDAARDLLVERADIGSDTEVELSPRG